MLPSAFLLCLIFLLHSLPSSGVSNLRSLTRRCASASDSLLFCGTYPPSCEQDPSPPYTCKLLTTVEKFEFDCTSKDLSDPYHHILCTKKKHTYLINILRLLPPAEEERSCSVSNARSQCSMLEYVGLSLTPLTLTPGGSGDDEIFYICAADEPHVTSWTNRGKNRLQKYGAHAKHPYQRRVFNSSGIGVYFENMAQQVPPEQMDFGCEFVISVEGEDLEFIQLPEVTTPLTTSTTPTTPSSGRGAAVVDKNEAQTFSLLDLPLDKELHLKMIQGWVTRSSTNAIMKVNMEVPVTPRDPDPTDPNPAPTGKPNFEEVLLDKTLTLNKLVVDRTVRDHSWHERERPLSDDQLHQKYWDPLFETCRHSKSICYVLDDDPKCWRIEKEECTVLVNFQFVANFTQLRVRMSVENWNWGGFSFSSDRFMGDDLGFYCTTQTPHIWPQLHFKHSSIKGNDSALSSLVEIVSTIEQTSEIKRYCEWLMPSSFVTSQSPVSDKILEVNLLRREYYVMLAVGNTQGADGISYHSRNTIRPAKFSKKTYLQVTGVKDTTRKGRGGRLGARLILVAVSLLISILSGRYFCVIL